MPQTEHHGDKNVTVHTEVCSKKILKCMVTTLGVQ